ncbi:MAG: SET domain-containing methyltransferase [Candidatus Moraniibacteriota bacterium]
MHMDIKDTFSWTNSEIEVRDIAKYGRGIFAKNEIKKGEMLAVFGGYVMNVKDEKNNLPDDINDNAVQISEDLVLGIKKESELEKACYFNHSCNPNAGFRGQIFLVAMKNIKKDEQVTFDYGTVLFRSKNGIDYQFDCACGKSECRKVITNNDWKIKKLQQKYKGYFQHYLEEKINIKK